MECDSSGRVVRMSDHVQALALEPKHPLDIATAAASSEARLWRVWQGGESTIYASLPSVPETDRSKGLAALGGRLVGHLLRLMVAERRLFLRARPRRRTGGRRAIRQIEMERRR